MFPILVFIIILLIRDLAKYSKISDKYDKIVIEVMTTDTNKDDKIIRNISNITTIDKMIK